MRRQFEWAKLLASWEAIGDTAEPSRRAVRRWAVEGRHEQHVPGLPDDEQAAASLGESEGAACPHAREWPSERGECRRGRCTPAARALGPILYML